MESDANGKEGCEKMLTGILAHKLAKKEIEDYEAAKRSFYNNPLHWNNNKRRRHGFPALRGNINRERSKRFRSFRPSTELFNLIDDEVSKALSADFLRSEYYKNFVEEKVVVKGDHPYAYYLEIE